MKFENSLKDDPCPCGICEAINEAYYKDKDSQCKSYVGDGGSACTDKDKALIKLLYHILKKGKIN